MQISHSGPGQVSLLATGDVGPVHGAADGLPIENYSELVRPVMASVDLRFGNCERQYSDRGSNALGSEGHPHGRQPPSMARIFTDCGFDAVTMANNHMYDFGPEALLDTRALLIEKGIRPTGAGKDLAEAREPAIVECKGIRIGFLGYSSVVPAGGNAGPGKIGIAALRIKTDYEHRGPHSPVRVLTEPHEEDLRMVLEDVKALRPRVDVLMVAFHWGVVWVPRVVSDYEVTLAHACIDAGADLIMGHHSHVPKAIEMYKGKPIFYSLSNFCMTKPKKHAAWDEAPWKHGALRNHADQDPDYPLLPYGRDAKRSLMAKTLLTKDGIQEVSFLPMMIDTKYRPEVLRRGDPRFDDMVNYMEWASDGFDHRFTVRGDEVVVTA